MSDETTTTETPEYRGIMPQDHPHRPFVDRVMAHARDNYARGGWDIVYECWDTWDVSDVLVAHQGDEAAALAAIGERVGVRAEVRDDVRNS